MKLHFAIRNLLVLVAIFAFGLSLWRILAIDDKKDIVTRFRWHEYSTGVACQRGSTGWRHCGTITDGAGICVVLKHTVIDSKQYDGSGGYELSFQLPPNPGEGDRFTFTLVPMSRSGEMHPKKRGFTLLLDGEFTAHHFGQQMGQATAITKDEEPELTIKSIHDDHVVLHLKLNVPIPGFYGLDIDQDFIVRRVLPDDE